MVLVLLIAAFILAENQIASVSWLVAAEENIVVIEGQLCPGGGGKFDLVQLIGVAQAGDDQHLFSNRMPVQKPSATEFAVPANFRGERPRNDWYAVHDEIISRDNFFGAV